MNFENFYLIASKKEYKGKINPFAMTCQCYLETGNWNSELSRNANNYAGVKASGGWGGRTYSIASMEYVNGNPISKVSLFRKYANADSFISDYINSMISKQRYSDVRKYGISNYYLYFYFLWAGGWATDPNYVKKLIDVSFKLGPKLMNMSNDAFMNKAKTSWEYAKSLNVINNKDIIEYADKKFKKEEIFPLPKIEISSSNDKKEEEPKEEIKEEPKNITDNIKKKIRVIDPGHGGKDPGAINKTYNIFEKDIVLSVCKEIKKYLERMNRYEIIMTRENDMYMSVNKKGEVPNTVNADFMFSLHCDAVDDTSVTGHSDLYYMKTDSKTNKIIYESKTSKSIAEYINKEFSNYFPNRKNNGIKGRNLAVLRIPKCPAVLSEIDFISNNDTCKYFLSDGDIQDKLGYMYANAIDYVIKNIIK